MKMARELIEGHSHRYEFVSTDGKALKGEPLHGLYQVLSPKHYAPQTSGMADEGRTVLFGCEKPIAEDHVNAIKRLGLKVNIDDKTEQQAL